MYVFANGKEISLITQKLANQANTKSDIVT